VEDGSIFHIRIRCATENPAPLTDPVVAVPLLESASFYTAKQRWFLHVFLLMPDHLHALLSFPKHETMSRVISEWKRYQIRTQGIRWQENYFDHRIRNTAEYLEKAVYIRNNPVAKGLCDKPEDWPWVS
jgi:REP element-mobilizing transposase RayT